MSDLVVVIPSHGRPESVERTSVAFADTGADEVRVVYAVEHDDPTVDEYERAVAEWFGPRAIVQRVSGGAMAPSINEAAVTLAAADDAPFALAVLNDDHVPMSVRWDQALVDALHTFHPGVGLVYPDDGYQHEKLATVWAVTTSWVRALGRMIPARVGHLYADNAMMDLASAAQCITYVPRIQITHEHPAAGYGEWTSGHLRVNSREQYRADRTIFRHWQQSQRRRGQLDALRSLIRGAR